MASVDNCMVVRPVGGPYEGQDGLFLGIDGKGLDKAKALLPGGKVMSARIYRALHDTITHRRISLQIEPYP